MPIYEWQAPLTLEKLHKLLSEHPAFSNPTVALTASTITLSPEKHADRTLLLDLATGVTVTLPKATGSGAKYKFVIKTVATSNSYIIKVGNGTDIMQGFAHVAQDAGNTAVLFETAADSDTITLNRTTTGSTQKGEWFELEDIASDVYAVRGTIAATGTEATPFSATVA